MVEDGSGAIPTDDPPAGRLLARGAFGGTLMGLANLVPGISGGTMLLAAGIYPRFIHAIGEVTRLRFRRTSLLVLGSVAVAAALAVALCAGPIKDLVVHHRWIMYSLFIGLTLGGVPILWRLVGKPTLRVAVAAVLGIAVMAFLAFGPPVGDGGGQADPLWMFLAGVAGASAMILPGVSGGYLLLVLGVYVPLLASIDGFVDALRAGDLTTLWALGVTVVAPVGLGVVVGVVGVSNLLEWLLERFEKVTLGFLLGLLLGAVLGLWPFQQGVPPTMGEVLKGQTVIAVEGDVLVYEETGKVIEPEDWPTEIFRPTAGQAAGSFVLIVASFGVTTLVGRLGRER